jgi:hypothetical protein
MGADAMALHSYHRDVNPSSPKARPIMINRVQALVLGFLLMAWISLVAILVGAPEMYERRLRSLPGPQRIVEIAFVLALTAFIGLVSIGVLRRWQAGWLAARRGLVLPISIGLYDRNICHRGASPRQRVRLSDPRARRDAGSH